jgi:hypothetical protein
MTLVVRQAVMVVHRQAAAQISAKRAKRSNEVWVNSARNWPLLVGKSSISAARIAIPKGCALYLIAYEIRGVGAPPKKLRREPARFP